MTGLFYSYEALKSKQVALKVLELWGDKTIKGVDLLKSKGQDLAEFDNLILAVPTWFDGELPTYWDEMVPEIEQVDLKGKKVAIFGLGDQKGYSENFVDSIGILADIMSAQGAEIVGATSAEGYTFKSSQALRDGKFVGLALDFENQLALNNERIENWVKEIKKQFKS